MNMRVTFSTWVNMSKSNSTSTSNPLIDCGHTNNFNNNKYTNYLLSIHVY